MIMRFDGLVEGGGLFLGQEWVLQALIIRVSLVLLCSTAICCGDGCAASMW